MNELLCKLTGGHKYSPIFNPAVCRVIDDFQNGECIVIDTCGKCGHDHVNYIKLTPEQMIFRRFSRGISTPCYEGRSISMKEFIAKNPKQLDICLKLLYAEKVGFNVKVKETDKHRIIYEITADTDSRTRELLREKYRILTS